MLKQSWMRPGTMPMDAYRNENELVITFDVPGVDSDAIEVTVESNILKVVAPRPRPSLEGIRWLAAERPYGTSTWQLHLSEGVDVDALHANCENGVLTITVPVLEKATRRIEITRGEGAEAVEAPAAA